MVCLKLKKTLPVSFAEWRRFTKISPATSPSVNKNKVDMGSKKLKQKKLKCKKLKKLYKLKAKKPKRSILFTSSKRTDSRKNVSGDPLSPKKYSRSHIGVENNTDVKHFAKVRENYFRYLQTVISNNCKFSNTSITEELLESLALELEQNALLACLQVDVYRRSMLKIIEGINTSTKEKQVHKDVKKLLSDSRPEKAHQVGTPKLTADSQEVEAYSTIPTIAFSRTENNLEVENFWTNESVYNGESYYPVANQGEGYSDQTEPQMNLNVQFWCEDSTSLNRKLNSWSNQSPQVSDLKTSENFSHLTVLQNNINLENHALPCIQNQNEEKCDPLSLSRSQLQKFVEKTLDETEKANKLKRDEQDRAYLARIFEGDDSLEQRFDDSLSDNENESKENIDDSNLMDRLEKMRELFGMEDEEIQGELIPEKPKKSCKAVSQGPLRNRRPTIWRYEKYIQLHKLSIIASEMTDERRQYNQKLFIELFGEDSDEEHEMEFSSTEKYRSSCTERISSWVVKYLMPFYHDKRILGRNVFKSLGHYISDFIVDEIQYPDEWTVKYFVSKFFPPKKKYVCEADFLNFELE